MATEVQTDYYHRPCGGYVFTKRGFPFKSGDIIRASDCTLPSGRAPEMFEEMRCSFCREGVQLGFRHFRIHVRGA